jgi:hypothetical protein
MPLHDRANGAVGLGWQTEIRPGCVDGPGAARLPLPRKPERTTLISNASGIRGMSAQLSWESVMWIADADRGERIKNPAASASTLGMFSRGRGIAVVAMLVLAVALIAGSSEAATLDVGPNKLYRTPSEAAARARDGDHIEIAPGRYVDCAVWSASNLFVEGVGPGVVIADKSCLDKGIFVIVGNNVTVRNLTLTGARVPGMNGAGIRQEGRNLTVDRVKFIDNQNGILGKDSPQSTVTISNSVF